MILLWTVPEEFPFPLSKAYFLPKNPDDVRSKGNVSLFRKDLLAGCCPNKNSFGRSLKDFLKVNLSPSSLRINSAEGQQFQLFEPERRVLKSFSASRRFVKKRFRQSEKGFGQQPFKSKSQEIICVSKVVKVWARDVS